ncbi:MAG: HD domain-containing protein [Bacteroidia bacterium]|nr:HD domain-containing protein [Bacteroidia bacterium]
MAQFAEAESFISNKLKNELSPKLTYHSYYHSIDVLEAALRIAENENVTGEPLALLRVAIMFHDSGFLHTYKDHEELGCALVRKHLPDFEFTPEQIELICGMIMSTKIPQQASNVLQQIICDADLDYLGRNDFYPIGLTLFEEWKQFLNIQSEEEWNNIQLSFLRQHFYHTNYSRAKRQQLKQTHLEQIEKIVAAY